MYTRHRLLLGPVAAGPAPVRMRVHVAVVHLRKESW